MIVRGMSGNHSHAGNGDERKHLRDQNQKLSNANREMRETMKARTTSLLNQRHRAQYVQHHGNFYLTR